jgi:hypothetical protein
MEPSLAVEMVVLKELPGAARKDAPRAAGSVRD